MALVDDLTSEVKAIFSAQWAKEDASAVPSPEALRLNANHAKQLDAATVLYADLDGSTNMVDTLKWQPAAEIYKAYLRCASLIIKGEGGAITAYDGDRVMAVFTGWSRNTSAVRAAMKINRAVIEIIRPAYSTQYTQSTFSIKHVVGIDTSSLRAARVGVRGDNDIVWVGGAANHAAKLCALSKHPIWITKMIHDDMDDSVRDTNGSSMWSRYTWNTFDNSTIYGTNFYWHSI
ncbi:MAG: adenylate/guanylate cyclase domain-containing protein [Acidiferrobacterales bacterium]